MTLDELQSRLTDAQTKRHLLATGQLREEVTFEGHSTRYTRANIGELKNYIAELQGEITARLNARPRRSPCGVIF